MSVHLSVDGSKLAGIGLNSASSFLHQEQKQHLSVRAGNLRDHLGQFDIDANPPFVRQTTFVCYLGESWNNVEGITKMMNGGMNIVCIDLRTYSHDKALEAVKRIRAVDKDTNYRSVMGIAFNISNPALYTGKVNGKITLQEGKITKLTIDPSMKDQTSADSIWVDNSKFQTFLRYLTKGDRIHVDNGMISLIVRDILFDGISCLIEQGGDLISHRLVKIPYLSLNECDIEKEYMSDLEFARKCEVDYVFTSYGHQIKILTKAKKVLGEKIMLFAKIDGRKSFSRLKEVVSVSDGVIIARGHLSLAYAIGKAPKIQKQIIAICNVLNKPSFVITQLLDSMVSKPRATRAEISDIGNAVLDGVDGLILTDETSIGQYPAKALNVLHKTSREAEAAVFHEQFWSDLKDARERFHLMHFDPSQITALAAVEASGSAHASAIFVVTTTGRSALEISSFRPFCPVLAITRRPEVARRCHSLRGIHPFVYTGEKCEHWSADMDARLNAALKFAKQRNFISGGDNIVFVTGCQPGAGSTNTMQIFQVPMTDAHISIVNSKHRMNGSAPYMLE